MVGPQKPTARRMVWGNMIALHDNSPAVVAPGIYPKWMRPSKRRAPDGAFYCFFRVDGLTDSFAAAGEILEQTKAGLAPGVAFGPREKVICNGHTNEIALMGEFLIGGCT